MRAMTQMDEDLIKDVLNCGPARISAVALRCETTWFQMREWLEDMHERKLVDFNFRTGDWTLREDVPRDTR